MRFQFLFGTFEWIDYPAVGAWFLRGRGMASANGRVSGERIDVGSHVSIRGPQDVGSGIQSRRLAAMVIAAVLLQMTTMCALAGMDGAGAMLLCAASFLVAWFYRDALAAEYAPSPAVPIGSSPSSHFRE